MPESSLTQVEEWSNRCGYHPPSDAEVVSRHEQVRTAVFNCGVELLGLTEPSREQSLMLTNLEESMFWANADIARHQRGAGLGRDESFSVIEIQEMAAEPPLEDPIDFAERVERARAAQADADKGGE